jgi:Flp pilus assembly pilin Flp
MSIPVAGHERDRAGGAITIVGDTTRTTGPHALVRPHRGARRSTRCSIRESTLMLVSLTHLLSQILLRPAFAGGHAVERERGASLVEYALLVALIALACFAAMQFFGTSLSTRYSGAASSLV